MFVLNNNITMYIPFNKLPDTARIWIYQANNSFSDTEILKINELLIDFSENWNNHGEGLKSSYTIKYKQFIIIAIDENHKEASGCSIDSSVQVIKKIEKLCGSDLMNKMNTAFKIEDVINIVSLADFQKYVAEGKITANTIVFNNMIKTIAAFKSKWEVSAKDSWHARYFN